MCRLPMPTEYIESVAEGGTAKVNKRGYCNINWDYTAESSSNSGQDYGKSPSRNLLIQATLFLKVNRIAKAISYQRYQVLIYYVIIDSQKCHFKNRN